MTKLAYLLGNNDYIDWPPLKNPIRDINKVGDMLAKVGFRVRLFENLDHDGMTQCIYEFGHELISHNVGLFYFAGHGIEIQGENYLIPINASLLSHENVRLESVDLSSLLNWMADYQENTSIVILDACRTNIGLSDSIEPVGTGLIQAGFSKGTFISYSTSPGSEAKDGKGDNSLFAEALIRFIPSEGEKIEDIFKKVRYYVQQESIDQQLPWDLNSLMEDFYFIEPRHSFSIEGLTPQVIYDYAENIWDDFEERYESDIAEALVFITVSNHFSIPLLEVYRGYSIIQNKEFYSFSDAELCVLGVERFRSIGFVEKNNRWYYEEKPIRMGEILPLPTDLEILPPETGQEIDAIIDVSISFSGERLIIKGNSNLPEGMLLMLSFRNLETRYFAQDDVYVHNKAFISRGFTNGNEKISKGSYKLQITSPIFDVQPEEVKPYLGSRCRNLTGEFVEFNVIGGNTVNYIDNINVDY